MAEKVLITGGSGFLGTNIINFYLNKGIEIVNADIAPPRNKLHHKYWTNLNILKNNDLKDLFRQFMPTRVIHLAGVTDLDGKDISYYLANTQGVINIIDAVFDAGNVARTIFASSMLVCKGGYIPKDYLDYNADTVYGESKVIAEKHIINNKLIDNWLIVRPTSIWGPWFGEPYDKFFRVLKNRLFFKFGRRSATRTYGYVGNTVYQIDKLLFYQKDNIDGKILYLGDKPAVEIYEWADEILDELGLPGARQLPYTFIRFLAFIGDSLKKLNIEFPMNSFRLKNMSTDNILDRYIIELYAFVGDTPYSRRKGIKDTLNWLSERL